jgi:hypothetical protein
MDKVIDRIKKLLALAKSSNPNEAANAAAAAQRLMEEHELEEGDLAAHSGQAVKDPVKEEYLSPFSYRQVDRWRAALAYGVCAGFGCHYWWEVVVTAAPVKGLGMVGKMKRNRALRVIGRATNLATAQYMFLYLDREVQRLAQEAYLLVVPRPLASGAIRWRNSFMVGAVRVITDRLAARREEFLHPVGEASTALVVVQRGQAEVDAVHQQREVELGLRSLGASKADPNLDAYLQGKEAGEHVSLGASGMLT